MGERAVPGVPRAERWTPPDFSDLEALAAAVEEALPDLAPARPLRVLGEGFFSVAVATASGAVLRLATSPDATARHRKEWALLPWLARQRLPIAIPQPRWLLEAGAAFPFGGVGYPLLPGRTLRVDDLEGRSRRKLAQQIAAFNLLMHGLPANEAAALGVPGRDVERLWNETYSEVSRLALRDVLSAEERERLDAWWRALFSDSRLEGYAAVLVHGDIGDENLLVNDDASRIVGVLDFEHAVIGDPAHDFRQLHFLGEDFMEEVIEAYRALGGEVDAGMGYRIDRYRQLSTFSAIHRGWGRGERAPILQAPERLRAAGIL